MAQDVALAMGAGVVLLLVAIFSTGVRQDHVVGAWLLEPAAEALIARQIILSIAVITVGAGPSIEGEQHLRCLSPLSFHAVVGRLLDFVIGHLLFLVFICSCIAAIIGVVLVRIELPDPSLDAPEMERLAALLAVPDCTPLVDGIGANDTLLGASGQRFHQCLALISQVMVLAHEVEVIVAHACFVFRLLWLITPQYLELLRGLPLGLYSIVEDSSC